VYEMHNAVRWQRAVRIFTSFGLMQRNKS
jgi:hypothetical protein